ncbi:MAG TPA: PAS domain-containing protein [Dongiaceae bacterium]|nr:PAS domain-containing protein [Dongiaceae bacterium]
MANDMTGAGQSLQDFERELGHSRHPQLAGLYRYWRSKCGDRRAPSRADILPEEIRSILPHILLLDIVGDVPRLKYRLAGTEFAHIYGAEVTGKFLDEIDFDGMRDLIIADYFKVVKECQPSWTRWSFAKDDGRWLEYERVTLPLSQDGEQVDMLLAGVGGGGLAAS